MSLIEYFHFILSGFIIYISLEFIAFSRIRKIRSYILSMIFTLYFLFSKFSQRLQCINFFFLPSFTRPCLYRCLCSYCVSPVTAFVHLSVKRLFALRCRLATSVRAHVPYRSVREDVGLSPNCGIFQRFEFWAGMVLIRKPQMAWHPFKGAWVVKRDLTRSIH